MDTLGFSFVLNKEAFSTTMYDSIYFCVVFITV